MQSLRITIVNWKGTRRASGDVVALCTMQENVPSSISLRLLMVSLLSVCWTPGSLEERNPTAVEVTTLYLRSWLTFKNCPFFLHKIFGCGIPSAVQLNVTVLSSLEFIVNSLPLAYNNCAGTIIGENYFKKLTVKICMQLTQYAQLN